MLMFLKYCSLILYKIDGTVRECIQSCSANISHVTVVEDWCMSQILIICSQTSVPNFMLTLFCDKCALGSNSFCDFHLHMTYHHQQWGIQARVLCTNSFLTDSLKININNFHLQFFHFLEWHVFTGSSLTDSLKININKT